MTMVGGVLNSFLTAADSPEREGGLWMPDRDDTEAIADPLAGLASRRAPEGLDNNPDAVDVGRLVVAVIGYVGKQLRRRSELRGLPMQQRYADEGAFDPSDPDRWPPTSDEGEKRQDEDDGPRDREARGFLGRRFGGQSAPTAPTTGTGGPEPTTEDEAS